MKAHEEAIQRLTDISEISRAPWAWRNFATVNLDDLRSLLHYVERLEKGKVVAPVETCICGGKRRKQ